MIMDSELMHSIVGSYLKPPERVFIPSFTQNDESSQTHHSANLEATSPKMLHSPNSQALILALKTLQEKIHRLELERTQAEDNLNILSREAAQYKKALEKETNERNLAHQELIKQKKDITIQLSSAQSRCTLLEKQLEYTKRMVLNVEREKNMILEQQAQLQREKEQDHRKLQAKLEKLDVLEKECFKLTTTQKTAEDKIKHLEEKLKEEEHQRKLFQDKASELQTGLEINRILMSSVSNPKHCKEKKKKSLKKTRCLKGGPPQQIHSEFGSLPVVAEKSASANYPVNASMQSVLQLMQHYGPHNCQKLTEVTEPRCLYKPTRTTSQGKAEPSDSKNSISIGDNLSELLMAMQDELDQMSMEHEELLNQMKETESHLVCEDIECELEHLVKKMEIKGEQISKLLKHQDNVRKLQQKVQNSKMSEASGIQREESNLKGSKNIKNSPRKCLLTNSLQKNSNFHPVQVHNLQMKLRRDDIMWEQ
ncbi:centrosomal protein CEP57L1 isoform X1 [Mirounga angustirostris]|uniref:centrosomal protein CEP57L1 n=3 Tax=Mirounga TaxID=9714 RepID=UPI00156C1698|nr:centrosomal protein CEP57L1 [Mirounga leonina]XP_034847656.1 centrosomal protein CEP57L1 [Mirounga leonina]XP_034847657.1 centrosomal protein CEP57L1 [Mirounga leonina]XP_034847658.1 centrosomal protein CEP57L1 [Mirounga leonina]XP_045721235.1 centrosomal protein CEP57L1 isoform X1 [Mirounga angustirostris]XP_045721236.1 centrosomal protein CEP57L1 isoform X1 [Mirounga angustirostris]XP_045721237.1 centrosomal protein CEP57L1 isoform X1 [Mirounga angustirostris]XP_045721238.1 centrosomal 